MLYDSSLQKPGCDLQGWSTHRATFHSIPQPPTNNMLCASKGPIAPAGLSQCTRRLRKPSGPLQESCILSFQAWGHRKAERLGT